MNPQLSHLISNNVTLTIVIVAVVVYMVMFRGANVNNRGGCLRTIAVVLLLFALFKYFTGSGSLLDLLPGKPGEVGRGVETGASMTESQYTTCLQNGIHQMQLQQPAQSMCAGMSGDDLSNCLGNVLCSQGSDAGCNIKTQCQFQNAVGGVPGNTGKGIIKSVLCTLIPVSACAASPALKYPSAASSSSSVRTDTNYTDCLTRMRVGLGLTSSDGCGQPQGSTADISRYNQCVANAITAKQNSPSLAASCNSEPTN